MVVIPQTLPLRGWAVEWHADQEVLSLFVGVNAGGMSVCRTTFKALPHEFRLMMETMSGTNSPVSSFSLPTRRHPVSDTRDYSNWRALTSE